MRAATYERTGPAAEVLAIRELPTPHAGPGEVRVRVHFSGVNPSDVKSRAGTRTRTLPFPQIVPHSDGAGVIDEVGAGVGARRVGERVWIWNAAWGRPHGTAAEYVVLPAAQAVPLPDGVDLEIGACLGIPALTACHAIALGGGVRGRSVLVAGGAGAVGYYAVQFAKAAGARQVLATTSSEAKAALAREAGAELVIDYRREDLVARVLEATGGAGIERIVEVDLAANVQADLAMLRPGGEIVAYGSGAGEVAVPFVPAIVRNASLHFFIVYNLSAADRERATSLLGGMLAQGRLRHLIAARRPLERIAEAHDLVEQGRVTGNVVLQIG